MKKFVSSLLFAACLFPISVMAQEPAPAADPDPIPAEDPAPAPAPAAEQAAEPAPQAPSNDPGDIIANYFTTMGDLVAQNMETPSALIEKFSAYLKENEKAMRNASKAFDAKLSSMKPNDAEVYRETVQRKITPALNKLITLLIEFATRYPAESEKLDSMLKIDAKYTYQQ